MARYNACSELTKFWIETRHGCLVTEGVPVPVPYGQSDIDIVAMHPAGKTISLPIPGEVMIGPRLIIETKDEHDWDPKGIQFGKMLRSDAAHFRSNRFIAKSVPDKIKFTMLREAHYKKAHEIFASDDFDRLFVVHAIDPAALVEVQSVMEPTRVYWITIKDVVRDLEHWYRQHPRPAGLRHSALGDLWHLLVGYCGLHLD